MFFARQGNTDIGVSVFSLLHLINDLSSTWTVTLTLIYGPNKAGIYCFDIENHGWLLQREVGGYRDGKEGDWDGLALLMVSYDNAGSIESSNTRDDILRLIKKFEVPTISIDFLFGVASDDSGVPWEKRESCWVIWYFRLMTGRLWVTKNVMLLL